MEIDNMGWYTVKETDRIVNPVSMTRVDRYHDSPPNSREIVNYLFTSPFLFVIINTLCSKGIIKNDNNQRNNFIISKRKT